MGFKLAEETEQGKLPAVIPAPHPIAGSCSNPLEYVALFSIVASMLLQLILLIIFVIVRYGQRLKRQNLKVLQNERRGRKKSYYIKDSKSTKNGILEHREHSIHGTYKIKGFNTFIPENRAVQE